MTVRAFRAPNLTELHHKLCHQLIWSPPTKLDVISSVDVQIHNVIAEADRMEWEFDLKKLWLTPQRWSMMVKQYIDPVELEKWLEKSAMHVGRTGRGISMMRTRTVASRGGPAQGNKETRRWGSCMLAVSYKAVPRPQITLYSRTSYMGYLSALDLSIAWMCGRYMAQAVGMKVEDMSFVWMNEAIQYHNFKSMAYLFNCPDPELRKTYHRIIRLPESKLTEEELMYLRTYPALRLTKTWMDRMIKLDKEGKTLGDMTYNTYRRIRRRYHTEVLGYEKAQTFEGWSLHKKGEKIGEQKEFFKAYKPLPHTMISDLDFRAIRMPLAGVKGIEFSGEVEDDEDDED